MKRLAAPMLTFAAVLIAAMRPLTAADVKHVVLISVDGLAARYLDDAKTGMPTLRAIRQKGAAATHGMITTFPSVTWPSHTSLITGCRPDKHGICANTVYDRRTRQKIVYIGDPQLTKVEAIHVPTLYDAAHDHGLKTAAVIWPCTNGARSLDWVIPDANEPELHRKYTTPGLVQELAAAHIDISHLGEWGWKKEYGFRRDKLYSQVVCHLLRTKRPNLLLLHLVTPDGVQHSFGPDTFAARQAVQFADDCIKPIWELLQSPEFASDSALFVVSDHGFAHYTKFIKPNVVLKRLGLIDADTAGNAGRRRAWSVSTGGSALLYFFEDISAERQARALEDLKRLEGVEKVLGSKELADLGLPKPDQNSEVPQWMLTTRPGYSFDDKLDGEPIADAGGYKGCHGHLPQPPFMHATFLAAGAGIRAGGRLETLENIDVAPTIARLLKLRFGTPQGRPLDAILE